MSPRMKRRKKTPSPNLLRFFLGLWIVASLGYWIAGLADLWQIRVHWDQRVDIPFHFDSDSHVIQQDQLKPEAIAAGLKAGDRVEGLNGADYTGIAQWSSILAESHPGDVLEVDYGRPRGTRGNATITLVKPDSPLSRSPLLSFWQEFLI